MATKKKKLLLLSDDLRFFSGIATQSKELVFNTLHHYDWVQIGGAMSHIEAGKIVDLSTPAAEMTGVKDAYLKIYPVNGYGDENILFSVISIEKPDAIVHFTDPRFWGWLYAIERSIRQKIPITYLTIWDSIPIPLWNKPIYESCDALFCISKQTENIVKQTLGNDNCITI